MSLDEWLEHLERLHPVTIDLGLERIREVADRLALDFSGKRIVTVGGTNGKGSCVTLLSHILRAHGKRCGAYISPHLLRYNERVSIDGRLAADADLCEAFAAVEAVRGEVSLTYFEFGTLAALWWFARQPLDYLLLEVGLGGRLDAVNLIDADAAILTNVALDHMDWLGDTREAIGREKAGIFRAGRPAVYAERDMPDTVGEQAARLGAGLLRLGRDYDWRAGPGGWDWRGRDADGGEVRYEGLPEGAFNRDNAAAVLQVLAVLEPQLSRDAIAAGLGAANLPGRFQRIEREGRQLLLDVAHNPHAAGNLVALLRRDYPERPLRLIIAMLADKDSAEVVRLLSALPVRHWYIGRIHEARGADPLILYNQLSALGESEMGCYASVSEAFQAAEADAEEGELLVVTGSFFTVAQVLESLPAAADEA